MLNGSTPLVVNAIETTYQLHIWNAWLWFPIPARRYDEYTWHKYECLSKYWSGPNGGVNYSVFFFLLVTSLDVSELCTCFHDNFVLETMIIRCRFMWSNSPYSCDNYCYAVWKWFQIISQYFSNCKCWIHFTRGLFIVIH